MYYLIILHIFFLTFANGMSLTASDIYNLLYESAIQGKVGEQCRRSLELYLINLRQNASENPWALLMLDATSPTPSGLLSYNIGEMGQFDQCITAASEYYKIKGKYCLGYISPKKLNGSLSEYQASFNDEQEYLKRIFDNISPGLEKIGSPTWSICLPSNCSDDEISTILANNTQLEFHVSAISCQTDEDVYEPLTMEAKIAILILSIILYLMVMSSMYDITCTKMGKPVIPLLVIFSVYTNCRGLFETRKSENCLNCLNGIRVLSMLWIIFLHTFSVNDYGPLYNAKKLFEFKDSLFSLLIYGGDIACDTFLLVGGTLVTYTFFKSKRFDKKFNIFEYYIHRYFRIGPTLIGAVFISATLLRYMGSGPKWNSIKNNFEGFCKENWWSSILLIQNYVSLNKLCVGHSWYLNVDMQLYVLSPIFIYLLHKKYKVGILLIVFLILSSISYGFYISFVEELSGVSTNFYLKGSKTVYTNHYYLQTHTRASPWLLGLILGYYLVQKPAKKYDKMIVTFVWMICLVSLTTCLLGGYPTLRRPEYNRLGNSFFIAFIRPVWSLCVAWIIWACAKDCGGIINKILCLPVFEVLNKFTYSMYIIHVTLLYMIVFGQKTSTYFQVFDLILRYLAVTTFVFGVSVIWVLTFELPMLKLEKLIF